MELTHSELERVAPIIAQAVTDAVMAQLNPGRWMKISEAAQYARKSKNTLRKLIKNGDIYAFQEGEDCNWVVDRKSIDEFYESGR